MDPQVARDRDDADLMRCEINVDGEHSVRARRARIHLIFVGPALVEAEDEQTQLLLAEDLGQVGAGEIELRKRVLQAVFLVHVHAEGDAGDDRHQRDGGHQKDPRRTRWPNRPGGLHRCSRRGVDSGLLALVSGLIRQVFLRHPATGRCDAIEIGVAGDRRRYELSDRMFAGQVHQAIYTGSFALRPSHIREPLSERAAQRRRGLQQSLTLDQHVQAFAIARSVDFMADVPLRVARRREAALLDAFRRLSWRVECARAFFFRICEEPDAVQTRALEEGEKIMKMRFRFAGEADDERASDRRARQRVAQVREELEIALGLRRAVHRFEDLRMRVLQRHVDVRHDLRRRAHGFDDRRRHRCRIQIQDADPAQPVDRVERFDEAREPVAQADIAAVVGRVLGDEDKLLHAAVRKRARLFDQRRDGAALPQAA